MYTQGSESQILQTYMGSYAYPSQLDPACYHITLSYDQCKLGTYQSFESIHTIAHIVVLLTYDIFSIEMIKGRSKADKMVQQFVNFEVLC